MRSLSAARPLSPLSLAVRLGDHSMTKHILRKQCTILWVWGPVTQYSIDLSGIDRIVAKETAMLDQLRHPSICSYFGVCHVRGAPAGNAPAHPDGRARRLIAYGAWRWAQRRQGGFQGALC